jgi:hypothetical protein
MFALIAGIVFLVIGPILLTIFARRAGVADATLLNITNMYQIASAIMAALALGGVAVSLRQQSIQGRLSQVLSLRTMHNDLMRYALDDPKTFAPCFGPDPGPQGYERFRRHCYVTLRFRYQYDMLYMGELSENNMRLELLTPLFSTELGRGYWSYARPFWVDENMQLRGRYSRFIAIVDDEFQKSIDRVPHGPVSAQRQNQGIPVSRDQQH